MENKRKFKAKRKHTHLKPKKYISSTSLLLWRRKSVVIHCFVWSLWMSKADHFKGSISVAGNITLLDNDNE